MNARPNNGSKPYPTLLPTLFTTERQQDGNLRLLVHLILYISSKKPQVFVD